MSSNSSSPPDRPEGRRGSIRLHNVSQRYGTGADAVTAVGPVDLDVPPGEFLVLVGASGCGKSTLLRLIAGFEPATAGRVEVSGAAPVPGVTSGVVFQQPRLFPWKTVGGNVDLALKYAKVPKSERAARRAELLDHRRVDVEVAAVGVEGVVHRGHARVVEDRIRHDRTLTHLRRSPT